MPHEMRMPSLGQTTDELRIVAWLKQAGESVRLGEPLLEVETDKALLEVESVFTGTLLKILYEPDTYVRAGELIAYIGKPGEELPVEMPPEQLAAPAALPVPNDLVELPVLPPGKVLALPVTRKLAREHGIDLAQIAGSGPGGRIEKQDILARIGRSAAVSYTDQPTPRHRQVIARRLTRSIQTIPQITLTMAINMSRASAMIAEGRRNGIARLNVTHLLLRTVAGALRAHPQLNQVWLEDGPCLRTFADANVGLAVAAGDNLLVPTISAPDRSELARLVETVDAAIQRARQGNLAQSDLVPAAITISNLGMYHVDSFQAIVDPDQAAILAVGQITEQAIVRNGGIYIAPRMNIALTVDHRVVDGAQAAMFLDWIRAELEERIAD